MGLHSTLAVAHDAAGRAAGRGAIPGMARPAAGVRRRVGCRGSVPVARGRPVVRGALPRHVHRGERGHDLRRHPAPDVHVPAAGRSRRLRLAAALRRPVEPAAARRHSRARARARRAIALPVAQPPEPVRLLQCRRRRPPRRLRPLRARLLGKQPAPGRRVGGAGGARRGNARHRLRPALPHRPRRQPALRLARLHARGRRRSAAGDPAAAGPPSGRAGARPAPRHPVRGHHGRRDAAQRRGAGSALRRSRRPAAARPAARAARPLRRYARLPAAREAGGRHSPPRSRPRSGRAGPAASAGPPGVRTTRDRSRTWAAGRRSSRRG